MKGTLPQRVRLGVFEVDLRAGELRQDEGAVLVLSDQPLQILRILIEALAAFAGDIDDLESSSVVAQNDIDRLNHRLGEMCPYWAPFIRLIRMNSARALNIIW